MALRTIKRSERVAIAGKTGTGKTYLARHLTRGLRRFVLIDSKATLGDWNTVEWDRDARSKLAGGEPIRTRILAPLREDQREFYDSIFEQVYDAGDCTVYIDEAFAVVENGVPAMLKALYTRGREFQIGVWAATQRPTGIPLFMLSEADHFFCFFLQMESDLRRMASFMGEEVLNPAPDPHGFYYARSQDRHPVYIKEFRAGTLPQRGET